MSVVYLDTSAAMKLLVNEAESGALSSWLVGLTDTVASSWLLHTELHWAAGRHPEAVASEFVATVLDAVTLIDLTRGDLLSAGTQVPLRSHDALHLATALRIGSDTMVTYDEELADAARRAGLRVHAPS